MNELFLPINSENHNVKIRLLNKKKSNSNITTIINTY